jgi:hypothetical protein
MHARGFDSGAYLLANGVEVDERTVRCAKRLALLHRFDTCGGSLYIYRTVAGPGVMVFAKMRQIVEILLQIDPTPVRRRWSRAAGATAGADVVGPTYTAYSAGSATLLAQP